MIVSGLICKAPNVITPVSLFKCLYYNYAGVSYYIDQYQDTA